MLHSWGGFGKITRRSTEVLDLHSRQKIGGGDMSTPRHHLHLAIIRRGGEAKMFALQRFNFNSTQWKTGRRRAPPGRLPKTWQRKNHSLAQSQYILI